MMIPNKNSVCVDVEKKTGIRVDPKSIFVKDYEVLMYKKKMKSLYDLQEKYNKRAQEARSKTRVTFGVLIEKILDDADLNFNEPLEIWCLSDFRRSSTHQQTHCFLFVHGEKLEEFRRVKYEELRGRVVMLNGLRIVSGMRYSEFKNKFKKKKFSSTRLALALSAFELNDLHFIGKTIDFGICSFKDPELGICNEAVNLGRSTLSDFLKRKKSKKSRSILCSTHEQEESKKGGGRLDLVAPSGGIRFMTKTKPVFVYDIAVYSFQSKNVFVNPKSFRKKKRLDKKKKIDEENEIDNRKFFMNEIPKKMTAGSRVMLFQLQKSERDKLEEVIRKKDKTSTNLEIKERVVKISDQGLLVPKLGRGLKRKQNLVFNLSDSSDEEEKKKEPPKKKRKIE